MIKRLGNFFWRPARAYQNLPVKQAVWFTILMAILGITFLNYSRSNFVRPETFLPDYESHAIYEYGPHYDEDHAPLSQSRSGMAYEPDRGYIPEPEYGPDPGYIRPPFTVTLFQAAAETISFAAGWVLMAAVFYWIAIRLGGTGTFGQSAAVVGLSWFPLFLRYLVQGIFIWSTGLPVSWSSPVAEAVLGRLDLFIVWNVILLGLGFAAVFGLSRKRALFLAAGYRMAVIMAALGLSMITM